MHARVARTKCVVCGDPAVEPVRIDVGGQTLLKVLCGRHLGELTEGTRPENASHLRLVDQGVDGQPT